MSRALSAYEKVVASIWSRLQVDLRHSFFMFISLPPRYQAFFQEFQLVRITYKRVVCIGITIFQKKSIHLNGEITPILQVYPEVL